MVVTMPVPGLGTRTVNLGQTGSWNDIAQLIPYGKLGCVFEAKGINGRIWQIKNRTFVPPLLLWNADVSIYDELLDCPPCTKTEKVAKGAKINPAKKYCCTAWGLEQTLKQVELRSLSPDDQGRQSLDFLITIDSLKFKCCDDLHMILE
jgi:hypothetical protein